jgi:hypothetical protein
MHALCHVRDPVLSTIADILITIVFVKLAMFSGGIES